MPYFSFSLKQNFLIKDKNNSDFSEILIDTVYFSKSTYLWRVFNKKANQKYINFAKFEERKKAEFKKRSILFCLPPSIGFGDIVEYALAIKTIYENNIFQK